MSKDSKWASEKDNLIKLIFEDRVSYEEIGRMYNCTGANIKKVARRLGLELEPRRIINPDEDFSKPKKKHYCEYCGKELDTNRKYCNINCQTQYYYEDYIKKWKAGLETGYKTNYEIATYVRRYMLNKTNNKCELCGCDLVNPYTKLTILQIHHIDGDASNAKEENLQVLCPNCHAMTENFGSRNKSCTRNYRKEEYLKSKEKELKELEEFKNSLEK